MPKQCIVQMECTADFFTLDLNLTLNQPRFQILNNLIPVL